MGRSLRWIAAVGASLALVIGPTATAQAIVPVPVPGTNQVWAAFSNFAAPTQDDAEAAVSNIVCPMPSSLPKASKTEGIAIQQALSALSSVEKPAALAALDKSLSKLDDTALQDTLFVLGTTGHMGGAALVSLRMAQESTVRQPLVNAASLLLSFNLNSQARDLITWAAKRSPAPDPDGSASAAYLAAQAEIQWRYGKFSSAESLFTKANAAYSLATGPRLGIARSLYCEGKRDLAARWWARGQRAIDLPQSFDEAASAASIASARRVTPRWKLILLEPLIDPNQGVGGTRFADYHAPESANVSLTFGMDALNFANEAAAKWAKYPPFSPPKMNFFHRLLSNYAERLMQTDRSIQISQDAITNAFKTYADVIDNGPNNDGCGAADNFGLMWEAVDTIYHLEEDISDREHQIWTAAARQVANKKVNQYFNQLANWQVYGDYVSFLTEFVDLGNLPGYADASMDAAMRVRINDAARQAQVSLPYPRCRTSFLNNTEESAYKGPDEPTMAGGGGLCTEPLKGFNIKVSLLDLVVRALPVSLDSKVTCDSASLKMKVGKLGYPGVATLSGFAQTKGSLSKNQVEVFAGVNGSFGGSSAGMDENLGLYVKFGTGADGSTSIDFGAKSEASAKLSTGDLGYEVKHAWTLSFITGDLIWE